MPTTTLAPVDQEYIEEVVRKAIANMMSSVSNRDRYEIDLRERVIRVEEGLRHQSELMQTGFALMEKRFEQIDKRFEQVDKRFEQVDKRFEQMQQETNKRFEQMQQEANKRFEQMQQETNKRFEQMHQEMTKGFEQSHRDTITLHNELRTQLRWGFGILLTMAGLAIAVSKMV